MKTIVRAIQVHCFWRTITLPLQKNIEIEEVGSPEELIKKWAPLKRFENHFELIDVEIEQPEEFKKCPILKVICFKEMMYYQSSWDTYISSPAVYRSDYL